MILGYTLLAIALGLAVAANLLFRLSEGDDGASWFRWARWAVLGSTASVVGAALYLITLIVGHHFEVAYVAEYSAKRSAAGYLFAAFWGGQEGSILLWTFWTSILGAVLAFKAGDKARRVWPIYGVVLVFLLSLLLLKCPFALGAGPVPTDGKGLNPLLENMWMVIHPPILFLGFSSLLAPFAWCLYGLIYRDWDGWARAAFPWALFSFTALGLGLSLGGYWAYETLGWGGFWGWDPVENSSLVPWLFITALLHGIAIQNKNGGYKVTNFALGFLPFAFMSYGTFLTRTGLLADFSVHSFSSMGTDGYRMMLFLVISVFAIPTALILARARAIPKPMAYENILTREFGYFLSSTLIGILGLIVAIGMSSPLITRIPFIAAIVHADAAKGAAAKPEFYNQGGYPLILILTLAMAVTPYLAWKASDSRSVLRRLFPAYLIAIAIALAMTVAAMATGVHEPWMILMFATAMFAVIANLLLILPRLRRRESRMTVGGFVAHMGAGFLIAGIACLVTFSQKAERVLLIKNIPESKLGYKLTYMGMTTHPYDREHNAIRIRIEKDGRLWEARPRLYFAPWESKDTLFANPPAILPSIYEASDRRDPAILLPWNNPFPLGDLYVAYNGGPLGLDDKTPNPNNGFVLRTNVEQVFHDYTFKMLGVSIDPRAQALIAAHDKTGFDNLPFLDFTAMVEVHYAGQATIVNPVFRLEPKTSGIYSLPVQIPGPAGTQVMLKFVPPRPMALQSADPFRLGVQFQTMNAPDPTEAIMVDVSTKPLIWLVWLGTFLYTVGGFVAYRRRAIETGLLAKEAAAEATNSARRKTKRRD
jgi:cytochrome c-type biogenesis protein CcmF